MTDKPESKDVRELLELASQYKSLKDKIEEHKHYLEIVEYNKKSDNYRSCNFLVTPKDFKEIAEDYSKVLAVCNSYDLGIESILPVIKPALEDLVNPKGKLAETYPQFYPEIIQHSYEIINNRRDNESLF